MGAIALPVVGLYQPLITLINLRKRPQERGTTVSPVVPVGRGGLRLIGRLSDKMVGPSPGLSPEHSSRGMYLRLIIVRRPKWGTETVLFGAPCRGLGRANQWVGHVQLSLKTGGDVTIQSDSSLDGVFDVFRPGIGLKDESNVMPGAVKELMALTFRGPARG